MSQDWSFIYGGVAPPKEDAIAYILEVGDLGHGLHRYVGYLEFLPAPDLLIHEQGPGWESKGEALDWARSRAASIILTTSDGDTVLYE